MTFENNKLLKWIDLLSEHSTPQDRMRLSRYSGIHKNEVNARIYTGICKDVRYPKTCRTSLIWEKDEQRLLGKRKITKRLPRGLKPPNRLKCVFYGRSTGSPLNCSTVFTYQHPPSVSWEQNLIHSSLHFSEESLRFWKTTKLCIFLHLTSSKSHMVAAWPTKSCLYLTWKNTKSVKNRWSLDA